MSEIDDSNANRSALHRAAEFISAALRRSSPSARDAESWSITDRGEGVEVFSKADGVIATDQNLRRPLFGNRDYWSNTNKYHPERTGWAERAVDTAFDQAAERFKDEWLADVARNSLWLEEA